MDQPIHVAVGVLIDDKNCVLLARRVKGTHLEGFWEFPGGKVEADESVEAALGRELQEELGIIIGETSPLLQVHHDYGEKQVLLDVHRVENNLQLIDQGDVNRTENVLGELGRFRGPAVAHRYHRLDGLRVEFDRLVVISQTLVQQSQVVQRGRVHWVRLSVVLLRRLLQLLRTPYGGLKLVVSVQLLYFPVQIRNFFLHFRV